MRVLWVGDAIASTGFSRCTHAACDALHEAGHEVHVVGLNHWGDEHDYPYSIYPPYQPLDGGRDTFGVGRMARLAQRIKPDVIVLLNDPWNVEAYLDALEQVGLQETPVVGWLAVDSKNQKGEPLSRLDHVVVWTEWAARELQRGGYEGTPSVVLLGVGREFQPTDRKRARAHVLPEGIPQDGYIVGVVGRNQPRKRLDLTLEYFAAWIQEHEVEDAYLYLHVAPTGERACDLVSLARYHGLKGRVVVAQPDVGRGVAAEEMPLIYSAFDCLFTTTQGEGWGLPVLEAMACGTPCIVPDWSALGDWTGNAAVRVPCSGTALTAPLNGHPYTIGGVPDRDMTVQALDDLYRSAATRDSCTRLGLELAQGLTWERTGREFREILESVAQGWPAEATA